MKLSLLLLPSLFVISTCGLVYELITSTLASYLLGDSVTQFSTVIGVYLFAMGVGSYLCGFLRSRLLAIFIQVELLIGLIGGFSACFLFLAFSHLGAFRFLVYLTIGLIGGLVGLEIPLIMKLLQKRVEFNQLVTRVFTLDYVGALLGSLLFPFYLVPHLGLMRSAFLFGLMNALVAVGALLTLGRTQWARQDPGLYRYLWSLSFLVVAALLGGMLYSTRLLSWAEASAFADPVIYAATSPYQRVILTHRVGHPADRPGVSDRLQLYLNNSLQLNTLDEYRYHEALVHPGLSQLSRESAPHVLILGGGDGLALREILRYPNIDSVTLVDLDAMVTNLFKTHPVLSALNEHSLQDPRLRIVHEDAAIWLGRLNASEHFDFVVVDFPDPSNFSLGKLYSTQFYRRIRSHLSLEGLAVIQSTSPFFARRSYWCIHHTLEAVGFSVQPYHAYVPSFGEWGFNLVAHAERGLPKLESNRTALPKGLRYLTASLLPTLGIFSPDMAETPTEINRLDNQKLVQYFDDEWSEFTH